jgi:hypothetical protein
MVQYLRKQKDFLYTRILKYLCLTNFTPNAKSALHQHSDTGSIRSQNTFLHVVTYPLTLS